MTPTIRRWLSGWLASVALVAAVTVVIKLLHPHGPARGLGVIYILAVLWVAVRWGPAFAFVASLLSAAAFDYFSLNSPYGFGVVDLTDAEAFAAFLATAIMASLLASRLRRQAREAARLAQEQAALRRIASLVARGVPPIGVFSDIADEVRLLLGAEIALFARRDPDGLITVLAHWGAVDTDVPVGSRWPLAEPLATTSTTRADWTSGTSEHKAALDAFGEAARATGGRPNTTTCALSYPRLRRDWPACSTSCVNCRVDYTRPSWPKAACGRRSGHWLADYRSRSS
jgi:K+-sensing histidine kinase KdpD